MFAWCDCVFAWCDYGIPRWVSVFVCGEIQCSHGVIVCLRGVIMEFHGAFPCLCTPIITSKLPDNVRFGPYICPVFLQW